jgi:hypothetical protein
MNLSKKEKQEKIAPLYCFKCGKKLLQVEKVLYFDTETGAPETVVSSLCCLKCEMIVGGWVLKREVRSEYFTRAGLVGELWGYPFDFEITEKQKEYIGGYRQ